MKPKFGDGASFKALTGQAKKGMPVASKDKSKSKGKNPFAKFQGLANAAKRGNNGNIY